MIRLPVAAALAAGLFWGSANPATAQDAGNVSPQTKKINEFINKGYENAGIKKPADRAKDHEFMRRVFIDLIGRIPTPEEILDFERDTSSNKRAKLVNRLLNDTGYAPKGNSGRPVTAIAGLKMSKDGLDYNDAYAQNFAEVWSTWMLTRSNTHPQYREQFRVWLADQFAKGKPWNQVVREVVGASGRTASNNAVVFVLRHLGDPLVDADARRKGEREDVARDGKFDAVPITSRVTKLFLGIQSQCVQCHNHPSNKEYIQSDFWGINGFFRQTDRSGGTNPPVMRNNQTGEVAPVPQLELRDMPQWNTAGINESGLGKGLVRYEGRDARVFFIAPTMLRDVEQFLGGGAKTSGKQLPAGEIPSKYAGKSRREVLGIWVTEHDNFSKAFVNRMWGHLFGRGLNKEPTVDDFSRGNEIVHPELLAYLAEEFEKYNYDPKKLLEWICTSDAYNLSHVANKAYADHKYDAFFARMPLKAMSPEVMFDSLAVATRAETRRDDAAYKRLKNDWIQKLTQNFGDDEGNEINFNGTVVQALLMMNGREINGEVGSGKKDRNGVVEAIIKENRGNYNAIYDELFLMTVGRHPTATEITRLNEVRTGSAWIPLGPPTPKGPALVRVPGTTDEVAFFQDVFWALLNSAEFMLNH